MTPILVHLVRSDKNTTEMLDTSSDAARIMSKYASPFVYYWDYTDKTRAWPTRKSLDYTHLRLLSLQGANLYGSISAEKQGKK